MGGTGREGERRGRGEKGRGGEATPPFLRGGYAPLPNVNSWIRPWSVMHFVDIFQ